MGRVGRSERRMRKCKAGWGWGVWEGVVEQEVTEELNKEETGTKRGWRWSGRMRTQELATRPEALRRRKGRGGEKGVALRVARAEGMRESIRKWKAVVRVGVEWKAVVRVGVDADMESEPWGGWGGARGGCGKVRQGGDGECGGSVGAGSEGRVRD